MSENPFGDFRLARLVISTHQRGTYSFKTSEEVFAWDWYQPGYALGHYSVFLDQLVLPRASCHWDCPSVGAQVHAMVRRDLECKWGRSM